MHAKKAVFMQIGIQHGLNAKSHHKTWIFVSGSQEHPAIVGCPSIWPVNSGIFPNLISS